MKKNYVVLVMAGGKLVTNPMLVVADGDDENKELHSLVLAWMIKNMSVMPIDASVMSFDIDNPEDIIMLGTPDQNDAESEGPADKDDNLVQCNCLANDNCDWKNADGVCNLLINKRNEAVHEPLEEKPELVEDTDKQFTAGDLLFAVVKVPTPWRFNVVFTTKRGWNEMGMPSDGLGGHNMPRHSLIEAGLNDDEVDESVFECMPDEHGNVNDVKERLIAAGFGYQEDFQRAIDNSREE